jgi:hypothetical protein
MLWVVVTFADSRRRFLRWLPRGWRHVSVMIETPVGWFAIEPLIHWAATGWVHWAFDLRCDQVARYAVEELGCTAAVACIVLEPKHRLRFPMPSTCTEIIKHVLGVNRPWIWTPRGLYRHLLRNAIYVAGK